MDMSDWYQLSTPAGQLRFLLAVLYPYGTCLPGKRTSGTAPNHDSCGLIKHESSPCQKRMRSAQTSNWWHLHKRAFPLALREPYLSFALSARGTYFHRARKFILLNTSGFW